MRNTVTNLIEILIGAALISLGLMYLTWNYKALSRLTDLIILENTEDISLFKQYNNIAMEQIPDHELYATIMGYRKYPIMIDDNLVPKEGQDYQLYFTYIKRDKYRKEYIYDNNRYIIMIKFSHIDW